MIKREVIRVTARNRQKIITVFTHHKHRHTHTHTHTHTHIYIHVYGLLPGAGIAGTGTDAGIADVSLD